MTQRLEQPTDLETEPTGVSNVEISRTDIHDVLSNDRRIRLLDLLTEESPRELGELAEAIAAAETGESPPPRNKRQSAYVTLHQTHLPKLDELDIVDYDARQKVVALSEHAPLVCEHDEGQDVEHDCVDIEPYLGFVVGGLLSSLASAGGLAPFSAIPQSAYAVATLLVVMVGFAYHLGRAECVSLGQFGGKTF